MREKAKKRLRVTRHQENDGSIRLALSA